MGLTFRTVRDQFTYTTHPSPADQFYVPFLSLGMLEYIEHVAWTTRGEVESTEFKLPSGVNVFGQYLKYFPKNYYTLWP